MKYVVCLFLFYLSLPSFNISYVKSVLSTRFSHAAQMDKGKDRDRLGPGVSTPGVVTCPPGEGVC